MSKQLKEFILFAKSEAVVSDEVSGKIRDQIHNRLSPSQRELFLKILLIHVCVSIASLTICPQFGFGSWLWRGHGLMGLFMGWGEVGCALGCGATFLGFSCMGIGVMLSPAELKSLQKTGLFYLFILSALSLMGLMVAGGQSFSIFSIFWFFGAFLGGILLGVCGINIRKYSSLSFSE